MRPTVSLLPTVLTPNTMYQANSYHPEDSPSYIEAINKAKYPKKALFFANMVSLLWFYYCIGSWYGSKFIHKQDAIASDPALLFGATFGVWFIAFFLHIAFTVIKKAPIK
ncbi:MAG: hypothetical protein KTR29_16620 [Rhodothermaceae bacterium]|nr:hypothetical protein [Rhodothermaceae bacterium]